MSNGANDWRNCTNCRYSIWDKDDVLMCHRRAPCSVVPIVEDWIFPGVDDSTFCWEYRPSSRWANFVHWMKFWWMTMTYERRRRKWMAEDQMK